MARIALLCPDLLFGSRVEGGLRAAGHDVARAGDEAGLRQALAGADLLVVDLTDDPDGRIGVATALRPGGLPALGFYSHVEQDVRRRAEEAGFTQVVPRSRMAREAPALVERLVAR